MIKFLDDWINNSFKIVEIDHKTIFIDITFNFKEGNAADYKTFNSLADTIQSLVSNTDRLKPLRTYATRQETARRDFNIQVRGSESGWITETLVTPFWYDTEIY